METLQVILGNQSYLEDFITRLTYHSNALEGSTLTRNETYALTFDSNHCAVNANAKEIHQAINHKKATMEMLARLERGNPIDHKYLTKINSDINENIMFGGAYRMDAAKFAGSTKVLPGPNEIANFLDSFIEKYNDLVENGFTMEDVADLHLQFENIHPFTDGNGRTGRLLIDSMLIAGNQVPIVIPLEERNDYLKMLETNDVKGLTALFINLQEAERQRMQEFISLGQYED